LEKLLITGGLGFIGSNFIHYVLRTWDTARVVNLDSISYGANPHNLANVESTERYHFQKADITDSKTVEKLISDCDVVIHFAAETHVDRSISSPADFLHSNVLGTFTLLESARKHKLRKFIHISTDEVYGPTPDVTSFTEDDRLLASSPYAASKGAADIFVQAYRRTYGLETVILRCTNNFGPRQFPEKFIPKSIVSALLRRKVPIYGDGRQIRDWIYVEDFCEAIMLAIEKAESGTLYNVSGGNEIANIDVARLILRALDKSPDLIEFVEERPGHDYRYSLDSSRIRRDLGWTPSHTFHEALRETIVWYVKNEWWWKPLITDRILSATPWKEKW